MKLQLALDDITLEDAVKLVGEVQDDIDIVEIGTPMVIEYGMEAVRVMKEKYPHLEILADLKIMDAGYYEAKEALEAGKAARSVELNAEEMFIVKGFNLLTLKPMIYVANMSEEEINEPESNVYFKKVQEFAASENNIVVPVCARLEEELSGLDDEERVVFMEELGLKESGLDRVIKAAYNILGLQTFITAGQIECRAWTFKKGMKAPQCAGIIHTDFEKGFIRAEVMSYEDLIECGNETKVKENGKMRLEGKEYLMKDGDICHFRFNV